MNMSAKQTLSALSANAMKNMTSAVAVRKHKQRHYRRENNEFP